MTPTQKAAWAQRRMRLRQRVVRILASIRAGEEIDAIDLDRLHNYCMVMLMVLGKVQPQVLDTCVREAEIASLLRGEDCNVVMDEEL
jgi:hypothetical protein